MSSPQPDIKVGQVWRNIRSRYEWTVVKIESDRTGCLIVTLGRDAAVHEPQVSASWLRQAYRETRPGVAS